MRELLAGASRNEGVVEREAIDMLDMVDMADPGRGHQVQHAVQQAVAGAQDGDEAELLAGDGLALRRLQRRLDAHRLQRQVARGLVGHQQAELARQAAEAAGGDEGDVAGAGEVEVTAVQEALRLLDAKFRL